MAALYTQLDLPLTEKVEGGSLFWINARENERLWQNCG